MRKVGITTQDFNFNVLGAKAKNNIYKTIKNVVEDDVFAEGRMRFFTTINDERIEVPTTAEFRYGKDRLTLINYNIKQQNK